MYVEQQTSVRWPARLVAPDLGSVSSAPVIPEVAMTTPSEPTPASPRQADGAALPAEVEAPSVAADGDEPSADHAEGMIPAREHRGTRIERGSMRVLATGGIIGIATALGAVLVSQDVAGWIVGLAVGLTSVILAALLWSSRQL